MDLLPMALSNLLGSFEVWAAGMSEMFLSTTFSKGSMCGCSESFFMGVLRVSSKGKRLSSSFKFFDEVLIDSEFCDDLYILPLPVSSQSMLIFGMRQRTLTTTLFLCLSLFCYSLI